jgi:DNA-directed RNA polymerase subunit E'/Rpb7
MFSIVRLSDTIKLNPVNISDNIVEIVKNNLCLKYEHKILSKINSFVVRIIDIDENCILDGIVNDISGEVVYNVAYDAVIFNPIRDSIFDIHITTCDELGMSGKPSLIFDIVMKTPTVIDCIIPKDIMECDYDINGNCWISKKDPGQKYRIGMDIKIKILSSQIETNKIIIIGTIIS